MEGTKLKFQPKGSMCLVCAKKNEDCSGLEFYKMLPVLDTYRDNGTSMIIVKCSEFNRLH